MVINVAIYCAAGGDNKGDDAILVSEIEAIEENISKLNKQINFIIFTQAEINKIENLIGSRKNIKIINISIFNILRILKFIKRNDLFIYGGGGMIFDHLDPIYHPFIVKLSPLIIFKLFKKPVVTCAIGVGPIRSKLNKYLLKLVLNHVDRIIVRDKESLNTLLDCGVPPYKIHVTADPVFLLKRKTSQRSSIVNEIYTNLVDIKKRSNVVIGLSLRYVKNKKVSVVKISEICDRLIEEYDATIVFIPMGTSKIRWFENDLDLGNKIYSAIRHKDRFMVLENVEKLHPKDMVFIFESLDVVIGMRLHSLIFSLISGTPFVGIAYDAKVKGLFKLINMENYCLELEDMYNLDRIKALLDIILQSKSNVKLGKKVLKKYRFIRKIALRTIRVVGNSIFI